MNRKYRFSAGTEKDPDGGWSAWLNEIPWCCTQGDTEDEAITELNDAASVVVQYLEQKGEAIPQYQCLPHFVEVEVPA